MRKFKLIKNYPNSGLEKGCEVSFCEENINKVIKISLSNSKPHQFTTISEIIKFPENWEEIIEKKYQILSIKYDDTIYTLSDKLIPTNCRTNENTYKYIYENKYIYWINSYEYSSTDEKTIHSVKRLSDGEIFTVGDRVQCSLGSTISSGKIDKIIICKDKDNDVVYSVSEDSIDKLFFCIMNNNGNVRLGEVFHNEKPLFITEDGVEIFEGYNYYSVWIKDVYPRVNKTYVVNGPFLAEDKMSDNLDGIVFFSTEAKAKEYILINKPCLSIKDVKRVFTTALLPNRSRITGWGVNTEKMLDLVREKLEDGDK